MDELIAQVSQRTGLSHEQAQQAVQTVLDFVKSRLPAPIAGQIDGLLGGAGGMLGGSSGAATPPPSAPGNPSGNQTV